jgi:hypothetical protein
MPKIEIRIDPQEKEIIRDKAIAYGLNMSEYLRRLGLHDVLPEMRADIPAINAKAINELNRIGNNLNQLVKLLHEERLRGNLDPVISPTEKQVRQTIQMVDETVVALKKGQLPQIEEV